MKLTLRHKLLFTTATLSYRGRTLEISHILIDTGSASTVFATDAVADLGIIPAPNDRLRFLRGVGGTEAVFTRRVDGLSIGEAALRDLGESP